MSDIKSINDNYSIKDVDVINEEIDMKEYINQLVKALREDAEVYEKLKPLNLTIGEVKDNIAKLNDYKDDYNYCKKCPGIEKCAKKTPHISMYIVKDGNYISAKYEPCEKIVEQIKLDSRYLVKDFPNEWKSASISTLDLSDNRRLAIKEFIEILNDRSAKWLYIKGNHKVGKSFLLVTFANEYIAATKKQVAVIDARIRFKELADLSMSNPEEFKRNLVALSNVALLIIDDFGDEYKNEYIRDQIVMPLLLEREHSNRLTFFSSNYSLKEIQQLYAVGKTAGDIKAKQLVNIIEEMCNVYDVTGIALYRR